MAENNTRTPNLLVKFDGIELGSEVKGYEKTWGILYNYTFSEKRKVSGDVSGPLESKAEIQLSNIMLELKHGLQDPVFATHLRSGDPFKNIQIITLINAKGANKVLSTITCENVKIVGRDVMQIIKCDGQDIDNILRLYITCDSMQEEFSKFGQDASAQGKNAAGWNYRTASANG
ncbi:hypothetical protein [Candidatus Bodocaedibacter vickermanii]|uniref:Hcp1-like superfamily protein n=1 Tax=Candidatus Bodocaedibacter vickermanii TaxID=2741701 RepID=A0A7L9RUV4_9PROT|nr:Hcp1-like superfamily protein [Candidatus Paracaedibacteraceae bacterium 'Lake Konstanz']